MSNLSVIIIAYNEEANLARCLESVSFADEVIVVDSESQDRTREIAESYGAKVVIQKFLGYGQQKNLAASHATKTWIFGIDADEVVSAELKESILKVVKENPVDTMYQVKRLTNYCGKWIRHGGWYPDMVRRLFKNGEAKWTEPPVHEVLELKREGQIKVLEGDLLHYSFPTVKSQVLVNVKYAELGAHAYLAKKKRKPYLIELITRPFGKFIECYFLKLGLLDGKEGFVIAMNAAHSMFMKYSFAYFDLERR